MSAQRIFCRFCGASGAHCYVKNRPGRQRYKCPHCAKVSIDVIAFIPTLRKTWHRPESETRILYVMNVSRHVLTLFSLQTYNIAITLHSIAMIVTNSIMTVFIARKILYAHLKRS